ncbi:MAG: c-type cytochrome domain-containing protein, partial [Verrucomicrobiota bacterium]
MKNGVGILMMLLATGIVAGAQTKPSIFSSLVEPILKESCISCHGEEKQKGKLRLDSYDAIRKGGDSGPVVIPGQPKNSSLYYLTILPEDDPDVMPNKGERLTRSQTEAIRRWIEEGAVFPDGTTIDTGSVGRNLPKSRLDVAYETLPPPDPTAVEALKTGGAVVRPLTRNGALLDINLSHAERIAWSSLGKLAPHVGYLDLSDTDISDRDLALLARLPN